MEAVVVGAEEAEAAEAGTLEEAVVAAEADTPAEAAE